MQKNRFVLALLVAGALSFIPTIAWGQTFYGTIVGTVTDSTRAVVPNAMITLTDIGTGEKRTMQSDAAGLYQFLNLVVGNYRLEVEKAGFKHFIRGQLSVDVQNVLRIDVSMEVGAVSQTVEVTAATPLLQPETSSLGQIVEDRKVQDLPINGRNPLALVALVPGVVPGGYSQVNAATNNFTAWGNFQIGGSMLNTSELLWDNMPQSLSILNGVAYVPTEDAVQEFKVQTNNFQAEFGHTQGGVMNVTTKSGTNKIHGDVYEFDRNNVFDSNDFFSNANGVPLAPLRQNEFGVTLGGPVTIPHVYDGKDKTFVFGSWEGFRQRLGESLLASVPSAAEHTGDFSGLRDANGNPVPIYDPTATRPDPNNPGHYLRNQVQCNGALNVICPSAINPSGADFAKLWPLPNTTPLFPGTDVNDWAGSGSVANDSDQVDIRVDHDISSQQRILARYGFYRIDTPGLDIWKNKTALFDNAAPQSTKINDMVFEDTYTFSPTTILQARVGYLRYGFTRTPASEGQDLTAYGFPAALNNEVEVRHIPVIIPTGITPLSDSTGSSIFGPQETWIAAASLTKVSGRNTFKFGTEMRWYRVYYTQTNDASGEFNFDTGFTSLDPTAANRVGGYGFASLLEGYPSGGGSSYQTALSLLSMYRAFYAQDDIRVTNKLTLNLGLRYDQEGGYTDRGNRIAVWDPTRTSPLASSAITAGLQAACMVNGAMACTGPPNPSLNGEYDLVASTNRPSRGQQDTFMGQIAPRFGLAYRLFNNTVIRGGYGIYWIPSHDMVNQGTNSNPVASSNTNYVASLDGGLTPANVLNNPFPTGLVLPPGRSPGYQLDINETGGGTVMPSGVQNNYGYTQQWNFNIQQELPKDVLIDIAYTGSKGTRIPLYFMNVDQLPMQYLTLGTHLDDSVTNPFYGIIPSGPLSSPTVSRQQLLTPFPQYPNVSLAWPYAGSSIYHAMQLKVDKRFRGGQSLLVAYTVSKLLSDTDSMTSWLNGEAGGSAQNFYNRRAEKANCSFDVPQRMVISYTMDLPLGHGKKFVGNVHGPADKLVSGWALNGITTLQSGTPIWVSALTAARPDSTGQSAHLSGSALSRIDKWFNTSVFTQPAPFNSFGGGNVSRTLPDTRVEGEKNFDFSLFKNTYFGPEGKLDVQFRAEAFNLFNRVQFGFPGNQLGSSGFGVISSDNNIPRQIQLGMKFIF